MSVNSVQLEKKLEYSSGVTTKDKVLSVRVEESLYNLVEEQAEKWNTGSVSKTIRTLLSLYFIPKVYEEEWKNINSKDFEKFIQKVEEAGNVVQLQRYKSLLEELSSYVNLLRTIVKNSQASAVFLEGEMSKIEKAVKSLEKASILWRGELHEGKGEKKL